MGPGDLHRVFHRFGTRGEKCGFIGVLAADHFAQALGQVQVRLVGHDLEAGMGDLLQLGLHGRDDLGVIVADVQHTDAADEVQVALAVHVP
ncbi:hypothetical protein D3C84_968500 [compost metagenome]